MSLLSSGFYYILCWELTSDSVLIDLTEFYSNLISLSQATRFGGYSLGVTRCSLIGGLIREWDEENIEREPLFIENTTLGLPGFCDYLYSYSNCMTVGVLWDWVIYETTLLSRSSLRLRSSCSSSRGYWNIYIPVSNFWSIGKILVFWWFYTCYLDSNWSLALFFCRMPLSEGSMSGDTSLGLSE